MANPGKKVNKINAAGEIVCTYAGVWEAMKSEGMTYRRFTRSRMEGSFFKGFRYDYAPQHQEHVQGGELWEGADGLFNIAGWAAKMAI